MQPGDTLAPFAGDGSQPPTALAPTDAVFAPGRTAEHAFGVLYQGEHETPWDGTGAAVRLHARALATTGLPVLLRSFSNVVVSADGIPEPVHTVGLPPAVREEIGALRDTSIATLVPSIKHVVVRSAEHLRALIMPRGAVPADAAQLAALRSAIYNTTIVYSVWERDRVDEGIARELARCAECWVPCEQNRAMLVGSGVPAERVSVVPHPYDPGDPILRLAARRVNPLSHRFYSIGKWEPRKGYHELVGAFLLAYGPHDAATLTIKTSGARWEGYPSPERSLAHWLSQPAVSRAGWSASLVAGKVRIIDGKLPRDQILKLHYESNVYVSSSHGEAWNLGAWDAKLAGNAMVHVPYGGTADFADPETDVAVPWQPGPVHASYRWPSDAQWAAYDIRDLATALRRVSAPVRYRRPPGIERYALAAVGALMRDRALAVVRRAVPPAADYYESRRQHQEERRP